MTNIVERLLLKKTLETVEDVHVLFADAADEIERLRAALRKWDGLIQYQYNGSREAMSALQECAFETDAILKGYTLEEKE